MSAQHGKIARLPFEIREQINTRLLNGEPANKIVPWLNAQHAVQAILSDQFKGVPISEQNVSNWRAGGFLQWAGMRDWRAICGGSVENASQIIATGFSAKHLLVLLTARIASIFENFDDEQPRQFPEITALHQLAATLLRIHQSEQKDARLAFDRERLEFDRQTRHAKPSAPGETQPPTASPNPKPRPSPPVPAAAAPAPPISTPPTVTKPAPAQPVPAIRQRRHAFFNRTGQPKRFGIHRLQPGLFSSPPRNPAISEIPARRAA